MNTKKKKKKKHTRNNRVRSRRVVDDHHLRQIRLDHREVFKVKVFMVHTRLPRIFQ